jgi:hypothetical protein
MLPPSIIIPARMPITARRMPPMLAMSMGELLLVYRMAIYKRRSTKQC